MSKHPITTLGLMATFSAGLIIIVVLLLPPWASADRGPNTKLNLGNTYYPHYTRTIDTVVWKAGSVSPSWQPKIISMSEEGNTAYVTYGCASCHGLDAQGSAATGGVTGLDAYIIRYFVRNGPGGMPAFSVYDLPDDNLNTIIDWLTVIDPTKKLPPPILHGLQGLSDCFSCHKQGGVFPVPLDHVNRTIDVCLVCHNR